MRTADNIIVSQKFETNLSIPAGQKIGQMLKIGQMFNMEHYIADIPVNNTQTGCNST